MRSSPTGYDQSGNPRSGAGRPGRQLVAFLRPGDTTWPVPRTSRYTIYVFGPGGATTTSGTARAGGGGLAIARNRLLTAGTVLAVSVGRGGYSQGGGIVAPTGATTLIGGGLNLAADAGDNFDGTGTAGVATGGDANFNGVPHGSGGSAGAAGSDGSLFGSGGLFVTAANMLGIHPGGGGAGGSVSANGEIRIVDETP